MNQYLEPTGFYDTNLSSLDHYHRLYVAVQNPAPKGGLDYFYQNEQARLWKQRDECVEILDLLNSLEKVYHQRDGAHYKDLGFRPSYHEEITMTSDRVKDEVPMFTKAGVSFILLGITYNFKFMFRLLVILDEEMTGYYRRHTIDEFLLDNEVLP